MNRNSIIIVEDDEDDCNFLLSAIKDNGLQHQFLCFKNPIEALSYLRYTREMPSMIISDINMPYMSGISFKRAINEDAYLNDKKIPFIFLSGSVDDIDTELKLSVVACIKKPQNINDYDLVVKTIDEISGRTFSFNR